MPRIEGPVLPWLDADQRLVRPGCSPACFAADHADRTAQAIRADKQRRARLFGGSSDLRNPLGDHRVWTTQRREDEPAGRGHSEVRHEL